MACLGRNEDLEKAGIHITNWGTRARCSTSKPRSLTDAGSPSCEKSWRKPRTCGNVERAEQAEEEIAALTREISRAVGLGGRDRRAASASERARQTITKTIKAVLERIAQSDATFADMFSRCIKTGTFCSYQPDADLPIAWEFAATAIRFDYRANRAATLKWRSRSSACRSSAALGGGAGRFSVLVRGTNCFCGARNRTSHDSRGHRSCAEPATARSSCSGMDPAWARPPGDGDGGLCVGASASDAPSDTATKETNLFPICPSSRSSKTIWRAASLNDYRRWMGDTCAELAQIAPSLRRVFPGSSADHWNCRQRSSAAIFSRAFQRRWPCDSNTFVVYLCLRIFTGPTNRRWRF